MPDLPARAKHEGKVAHAMRRQFAAERRELLDLVGNPPDVNRIPAEFWQRSAQESSERLAAALVIIFLLATRGVISTLRLSISPGTFTGQANRWAKTHADGIAGKMVAATQRGLSRNIQDLVARANGKPISRTAIKRAVDGAYGRSRIEGIGITETTEAVSAGELAVVDAARGQGVRVTELWRTEQDARVCPICRPLHGVRRRIWAHVSPGGPPAHPNCRCWLVYDESQVSTL